MVDEGCCDGDAGLQKNAGTETGYVYMHASQSTAQQAARDACETADPLKNTQICDSHSLPSLASQFAGGQRIARADRVCIHCGDTTVVDEFCIPVHQH